MSWTNRSRVIGLAMGFACCATAFGETSINATVEGSSEGGPFTSVLTVGNAGCTVDYRVTVELTDTDNEGLALIGFDLELVDGLGVNAGLPLDQAVPTDGDMTSFVIPDGLNNPAGFGGTLIGNKLVQVGGGSNTIRNVQSCTVDADCPGTTNTCDAGTCTASAPYPIGAVITGIAQPGSPQVVVTGSFIAPLTVGTYAFKLTALFGNAIIAGEDGNPFWATKALDIAGGTGVVTDLALTVEAAACEEACAIASSIPADGAIDARQPKSIDGLTQFGWDSAELSFTCGRAADIAADGPAAFASTGPAVTAVAMVDADTVTVTLASRLVPETWTRITHLDSGTSVCLGFLPGDTDADGSSNPALDLGAIIDCINNPGSCADYQQDMDRDGSTGVLDITRLIDLFNGAGSFQSWTGAFIGASCPP